MEVDDVHGRGSCVCRIGARQLVGLGILGVVAVEFVLAVGQCCAFGVGRGHHDLCRRIDRSSGTRRRCAVTVFVDHTATGDDAVGIFGQARELSEGASEEGGSEYMMNWLRQHLSGVKVTHVPSGFSLSFA